MKLQMKADKTSVFTLAAMLIITCAVFAGCKGGNESEQHIQQKMMSDVIGLMNDTYIRSATALENCKILEIPQSDEPQSSEERLDEFSGTQVEYPEQ